MLSEWIDKGWGRMRPIIDTPVLRVEEIHILKGGFCSIHHHNWQHNIFVVFEGRLDIRYRKFILPDMTLAAVRPECELHLGQLHTAEATVDHQFLAFTFVRAIEIYTPAGFELQCSRDDIVRRDILGGVLPQSTSCPVNPSAMAMVDPYRSYPTGE